MTDIVTSIGHEERALALSRVYAVARYFAVLGQLNEADLAVQAGLIADSFEAAAAAAGGMWRGVAARHWYDDARTWRAVAGEHWAAVR